MTVEHNTPIIPARGDFKDVAAIARHAFRALREPPRVDYRIGAISHVVRIAKRLLLRRASWMLCGILIWDLCRARV